MSDFGRRLLTIQQTKHSDLGLVIAPQLRRLPLSIQRYDDPFLPFSKAIIQATRTLVCMYFFDLASFLSLGAAGIIALERTLAYAAGDTLTVLHGPLVGPGYAEMLIEGGMAVDGVTLAREIDLPAYTSISGKSAFVMCTGAQNADIVVPHGGIYWADDSVLVHPVDQSWAEPVRVRLVGEDALYLSRDDDFAERTRRYLEMVR